MAFPTPTALANTPQAGSDARLYMTTVGAATFDATDEVPLTSEDLGIKGSGDTASVRTHNGGMLYVKNGITKTFSFTMHGGSNDVVAAKVLTAADGSGDTAIMQFAILNPDGSYDYGHCIVDDKSIVAAPDSIFGYVVNCSVIGDGEFQAAV